MKIRSSLRPGKIFPKEAILFYFLKMIVLMLLRSFIKQYYSMLSEKPDQLFRFYKEESSFSHYENEDQVAYLISILMIHF